MKPPEWISLPCKIKLPQTNKSPPGLPGQTPQPNSPLKHQSGGYQQEVIICCDYFHPSYRVPSCVSPLLSPSSSHPSRGCSETITSFFPVHHPCLYWLKLLATSLFYKIHAYSGFIRDPHCQSQCLTIPTILSLITSLKGTTSRHWMRQCHHLPPPSRNRPH